MAVSDFADDLGVDISSFSEGGFYEATSSLLVLAVLVVVAFAVFYYILQKKSYNKKVFIFEEINGGTWPTGTEKAREIVLPNTSLRAFYLKKSKIYLPRPNMATGENNFWFFKRNDGEWVNIMPENVNTRLKELGLLTDHSDMRMAMASLKKLIDNNYRKKSFLKEWAQVIGVGVLVIGLGITAYLVVGEVSKFISSATLLAEQQAITTERIGDLLGSLDNIVSGSGVRSAG